MKNGPSRLYIVIGIVALIVISFLIIQNKNNPIEIAKEDPSEAENTDESATSDESMTNPTNDIMKNAENSPNLSIFVTLAKPTETANLLQDDGPYTVFAPSDKAFEALPPETLQVILELQSENKDVLNKVLSYHIISGNYPHEKLSDRMELMTKSRKTITISKIDGEWWVNEVAKFETTDIESSNGVLHIIDTLLLPPE